MFNHFMFFATSLADSLRHEVSHGGGIPFAPACRITPSCVICRASSFHEHTARLDVCMEPHTLTRSISRISHTQHYPSAQIVRTYSVLRPDLLCSSAYRAQPRPYQRLMGQSRVTEYSPASVSHARFRNLDRPDMARISDTYHAPVGTYARKRSSAFLDGSTC